MQEEERGEWKLHEEKGFVVQVYGADTGETGLRKKRMFQGRARSPEAVLFCVLYEEWKTATLRIDVHGDVEASQLARAWAHKMNYFLELHEIRGPGILEPHVLAEGASTYVEPPELEELKNDPALKPETQKWIEYIRGIVTTTGPPSASSGSASSGGQ